ncbi:MAG: alkyl hydroperoxide reductase subunit F [Paraprevotella sp.]|nr:alkyl hydroperoxide reductase subunit F [Paraprevotella sp.]
MLDHDILTQVREVFLHLSFSYIFRATYSPRHEAAEDFRSFLEDVASCSDILSCQWVETEEDKLAFTLVKEGKDTGIVFRGIPNGHEFTSLLLAVLNADGKGKNLPDEAVAQRIRDLVGPVRLQTYVSLTCTNCQDVVQALNIIALLNPDVTHTMVDGAVFPDEAEALHIQAVPSVYANGQWLHVGKGSLGELLQKLEDLQGSRARNAEPLPLKEYDVLVLGGGPAGASAAIYSARKGLRVALVAERVGGQVKETVGIENLISVPFITGAQLADALRTHLDRYPIDIFENRNIERADLKDKQKTITVSGGEVFAAPAVIIATGASWRRLNVEGEGEYIGRGVAFCPHCDGTFYKGKHVAVIGGGNSGIEAAIDLAGICRQVTVFEFADTLRADEVLQQKAKSLPNVEIFTAAQTLKVEGDGTRLTAIDVKDRRTGGTRTVPLDGIFVQIGLTANSRSFRDVLELTSTGEIKTDTFCCTSVPGVYAAGDVSDVPYKQIIIAMGEDTVSLSVSD